MMINKITTILMVLLILSCSEKQELINKLNYLPDKIPDRVLLVLGENPATECVITWRTDTTVTNVVLELAEATASNKFYESAQRIKASTLKQATHELSTNVHEALLDHLQPNSNYCYRVGDGQNWSEWYQFKTASKDNQPFSFLYFGDSQVGNREVFSRCIRTAYKTCPSSSFMLFAGDFINKNEDNEWGDWFLAGSWIYASTPVIGTPGNHEYYTPDKNVKKLSSYWKHHFRMPQNGPVHLKGTSYYIDYQGVRFVSVNTSQFRYNPEYDQEHLVWINKVLKDNPNQWTIVMQHHPNYVARKGPENDKSRALLIPLYKKYGVDLVLQGHDHTYGRGVPSGAGFEGGSHNPVYVVSMCGDKMYDLSFNDWVERCAAQTQLFQHIFIDGDTMCFKAYTADGALYDEFEIQKRKDGKRLITDKQPLEVKERVELPRARVIKEKWNHADTVDYNQRYQNYLKRKQILN